MSKKGDFLSGFSGGNTQKPLTEQNNRTPVKETNPTEVKKETPNKIDVEASSKKIDVAANKKLADQIVAESERKGKASTPRPNSANTATRPAQSANAIIKAPEHIVTKDEKFHKRKMIRYGIVGSIVIVVAILVFFIVRMVNSVDVPNWVGQDIGQITSWQISNRITVTQEYEYSLEHPEDTIIAQSREPGSTVQRGSSIVFTISRGADMNQIVGLPDFETMTRGQIRTWADEYQIRGITFRDENSSEVEANDVIRVEFPGTVDPDNFRRSDSVTIYVSNGPETVQIGNMIGNEREQVNEFIENNPLIDVEIEYESHETIPRGTVLQQSHPSGTRLAIGETFTLTLSAGDPIIVPNFADMRRIEAMEMQGGMEGDMEGGMGSVSLDIHVRERYHPTVPYGRFVSQSVEAGEDWFEGDPRIVVTYSLGRPWIPRMIDGLAENIESEIVAINDKGAFLTLRIDWVDSHEMRGIVIGQTHYNQNVALDTHIVFRVSRGNLQPPPGADLGEFPPDDE